MRIVFFGTPELAVPTLAAVAEHHTVVAVVTQPDRPQGRSKTPASPPVKVWAEAHGVPVHQTDVLNDGAFETWLRAQAPDICVVAAYGRLLKQPILDVPALGWLNVHPSLLPRWRGPSPIQTAILAGDDETGVSIMRMILAMDAGDVVLQTRTPIGEDETAGMLTDRLAQLGATMMVTALERLVTGELYDTPQDPSQVTVCHLFRKEDGRIRWARPAVELARLVRAAHPWPVAHCLFQGEVVRLHRVTVRPATDVAAPGTVVACEHDCVWVATGEGLLGILEFQAPGKRALPMSDFLRGRAIQAGDQFVDL